MALIYEGTYDNIDILKRKQTQTTPPQLKIIKTKTHIIDLVANSTYTHYPFPNKFLKKRLFVAFYIR